MTYPKKSLTPTWWEVTVEVTKQWSDDAAASLMAAGALGVQIIDGGAEPLPDMALVAILPQYNVARDADHAMVVASYNNTSGGEGLAEGVAEALSELGLKIDPLTVHVQKRADRDWAETWKQYFKPMKVARRLWIVPTWETSFQAPLGSVVLLLDPGMAFGTGQHPTTALCLKAIEQAADVLTPAQRSKASVLDFGCGTGILGIAAAKLGYQSVLATDNDPDATDAARVNVAVNGTPQVRISDVDIKALEESFDLVVANILAVTLIDLVDPVLRRLRAGGSLVLSGILATQADDVISAYERHARKTGRVLAHTNRWTHGEWVALRFQA